MVHAQPGNEVIKGAGLIQNTVKPLPLVGDIRR